MEKIYILIREEDHGIIGVYRTLDSAKEQMDVCINEDVRYRGRALKYYIEVHFVED